MANPDRFFGAVFINFLKPISAQGDRTAAKTLLPEQCVRSIPVRKEPSKLLAPSAAAVHICIHVNIFRAEETLGTFNTTKVRSRGGSNPLIN